MKNVFSLRLILSALAFLFMSSSTLSAQVTYDNNINNAELPATFG